MNATTIVTFSVIFTKLGNVLNELKEASLCELTKISIRNNVLNLQKELENIAYFLEQLGENYPTVSFSKLEKELLEDANKKIVDYNTRLIGMEDYENYMIAKLG